MKKQNVWKDSVIVLTSMCSVADSTYLHFLWSLKKLITFNFCSCRKRQKLILKNSGRVSTLKQHQCLHFTAHLHRHNHMGIRYILSEFSACFVCECAVFVVCDSLQMSCLCCIIFISIVQFKGPSWRLNIYWPSFV